MQRILDVFFKVGLYISQRSADKPAPSGGVGGTARGVKCLHAHYAHTAAGGDNPVGKLVAGWIEPLDCEVPCVVDQERNPEWVNLT